MSYEGQSVGPVEPSWLDLNQSQAHVPAGRTSGQLTEPLFWRWGSRNHARLLGLLGEFGDPGYAQEVCGECWWLAVVL